VDDFLVNAKNASPMTSNASHSCPGVPPPKRRNRWSPVWARWGKNRGLERSGGMSPGSPGMIFYGCGELCQFE